MPLPILRDYQAAGEAAIYKAWKAGHKVVFYVLATGGGKTVIFAKAVDDHQGVALSVAHRQELVDQISLAMAARGIYHRIIAPDPVIKNTVRKHMEDFRRSYYDPTAPKAVGGVDTILSRKVELGPWLKTVTLWVQDEGHHTLDKNKWGKVVRLMPKAKGLLVSATPGRADGKGLGRHADGVADTLIQGPCGYELIQRGHLADYRIICPDSNLDVSNVGIGSTGDYVPGQLKMAVRGSTVVGDIVTQYLKHTPGMRGITFIPDRDTGAEVAENFRAHDIPAEFISHKTPGTLRDRLIRQFRGGDLLQLVNIDLFGEGFDVPAVQVVSDGAPTQSFARFAQRFGRMLRLPGPGTYLDHARNCIERHGLPDKPRQWSLDRRERRHSRPSDVVPCKVCPQCEAAYERIHRACPYCGFYAPPASRSGPQFVDGDLIELDAATLAAMRGDVSALDLDKEEYRAQLAGRQVPLIGQMAHVKSHVAKQEAQARLRDTIALWAGYQRAAGRPDSESYRRFYFKFGVDVLTAQTLGIEAADKLADRVGKDM